MIQRTLILIKPDALERGLAGIILERFERAALRVADARFLRASRALLEQHYAELAVKNAAAFQRTVSDLEGKAFLAILLDGRNAVQKVRNLLGPTDPCAAPAGTIRGDFSSDTIAQADAENRATENLLHAADSEASAARETTLWFDRPGG